jgi:membrane protease YdiL (CAAX protease family)
VSARAEPERSDSRLVLWLLTVGAVAALGYASRFGLAGEDTKPPKDALYRWDSVIGGLVQFAIFLAIVLAISGASRERLALRRPRSWRVALGLAALIYVSSFVLLGLLDQIFHGGDEQGLTPDGWRSDRAAAFVANFVVVAVVAPIVEELLFRGIGFHLLERFGRWPAIVTVGLSFGLYHGLVNALPVLALFGMGLAWLRARTNSVYPGILVHAAFNGVALIVAVTYNH